jgi:hypothetical protein
MPGVGKMTVQLWPCVISPPQSAEHTRPGFPPRRKSSISLLSTEALDSTKEVVAAAWESGSPEGAWRRVARARAQVPRSAARRGPVNGGAAESPAAGGRQRGV